MTTELLYQELMETFAPSCYHYRAKSSFCGTVDYSSLTILELIRNIASVKKKLALPIVGGRHIRRISNRELMQNPENAAAFISSIKIGSFTMLEKFADEKEKEWELLDGSWKSMTRQLEHRKDQLQIYARYEPCARIYKESLGLKGFAKLRYDREHKKDIDKFPQVRSRMASLLDNGEKIDPEKWHAEIRSIEKEMDSLRSRRSKAATALAYAELISYNRKDFEREKANRSRQQQRKLNNVRKKRTYDMGL